MDWNLRTDWRGNDGSQFSQTASGRKIESVTEMRNVGEGGAVAVQIQGEHNPVTVNQTVSISASTRT